MSAIEFRKARTTMWEFCANGCKSPAGGADRGPTMGQTAVFLMGRPIGGTLDRSFFCAACVKEMKQAWDEALREREEADQHWTRAVDEPAVAA